MKYCCKIVNTDLTDTNNNFCHITIQCIGKIVDLSDDIIDQVCLVSHALEEQVEIGGATVRFHIQLGQIWLKECVVNPKQTTTREQCDILERCSEAPCTPSLRYS